LAAPEPAARLIAVVDGALSCVAADVVSEGCALLAALPTRPPGETVARWHGRLIARFWTDRGDADLQVAVARGLQATGEFWDWAIPNRPHSARRHLPSLKRHAAVRGSSRTPPDSS
jgi:hypothetical protein